MRKTHLLFLVILIEGYVVLACELLVIRQLIPFVGSGIETTAIIISGVLLPLAIGYHFGGIAYARACSIAKTRGKALSSVRTLLLRNILVSLTIMMFGFSYVFIELFFSVLTNIGLAHRLIQTTAYVLIFLISPMFLLGQTVPLTSNYFSRRRLSDITGKMLFFSTTGAFLGSLFSTLVLMSFVGVHNTVIITIGMLCFLVFLISGRKKKKSVSYSLLILFITFLVNNDFIMKAVHVVSDNAYNTVRVFKAVGDEDYYMFINRSVSSERGDSPEKRFELIKYIERYFIDPYLKPDIAPREILVIGAGGFALGLYDKVSNYTYVDIDSAIKEVAEKEFLKEKLASNKKFVTASAREFLRRDDKKYDVIVVDVYTMVTSIPMEAITREFFVSVKSHLKKDGVAITNTIAKPSFGDKFSVRYNNTFASVFPVFTRQIIEGKKHLPTFTGNGNSDQNYNNDEPKDSVYDDYANILYIYVNGDFADDSYIYTDDKNTVSLDRL